MEELKQRVDEYWGYAVQESWDLYWLRLWLELLVPTMLSSPNGEIPSQPQKEEDYRAWSLGESLPFSPSRTVEGISEGDVDFLCGVFDVAEKDRLPTNGKTLFPRHLDGTPEGSRGTLPAAGSDECLRKQSVAFGHGENVSEKGPGGIRKKSPDC